MKKGPAYSEVVYSSIFKWLNAVSLWTVMKMTRMATRSIFVYQQWLGVKLAKQQLDSLWKEFDIIDQTVEGNGS